MGLLNKRNIAKAKAIAEKNKDKIASSVNKATGAIDKKTGGKHTDKLKKIDDAAKKFAGEEVTTDPAASDAPDSSPAANGGDSTTSPTT